jgi:Dullard-like phosphatase family protein
MLQTLNTLRVITEI